MRLSSAKLALAALLLLTFSAASSRAQHVTNGDFEAVQLTSPFNSSNPADIPGWTHTGATGDALLWAVGYADGDGSVTVAGHGNQFVTMGSGFTAPAATAAWQQTVTGFTPGKHYNLNFEIASEADFSGAQSLTAGFLSGSSTASQTFTASPPTGNYWRSWDSERLPFVANNSSVTLQFSATARFDVGLDNVSVTTVPEASTLVIMIGAGLTSFLTLRRRR